MGLNLQPGNHTIQGRGNLDGGPDLLLEAENCCVQSVAASITDRLSSAKKDAVAVALLERKCGAKMKPWKVALVLATLMFGV